MSRSAWLMGVNRLQFIGGCLAILLSSIGLLFAAVPAFSDGSVVAKVAPAKAYPSSRNRIRNRVRYDDLGGASISWAYVSQWKWSADPPVGQLLYCIANGTADIAGSAEVGAIEEAIKIWDAAAPRVAFSKFCFTPTIVFKWAIGNHGDGSSFDGEGGILAHAFFPNDGDVHLDDGETWTLNERETSAQPIDLVTVAAHEIGHSLGFDHSSDSSALMWPYYTGSHRYLSEDDLEGLKALYSNLTD